MRRRPSSVDSKRPARRESSSCWRRFSRLRSATAFFTQQNGRHERLHRTLKADATKPAAPNVLQQQARFDTFIARYNHERPHQALDMQVPADLYTRSARVYRGLEDVSYPFADATFTVTH